MPSKHYIKDKFTWCLSTYAHILKEQGHKLILWTSRGEPALQEAIEWCIDHKLEFDDINVNPFFDKKSGPSPKIVADYYIDDKALEFKSLESRKRTIEFLKGLV